MSRASARRSGTNCGRSSRCNLVSATCKRRKCTADVPGQLQLLAGEHQHLLDLGQRPFVARWRKLSVQRLERGLLRLRFAETIFQKRDLGLRVAQVLLGILDDGARRLLGGFDFGETLRELDAQLALPMPCVQPRCRDRGSDHQRGDPHPERKARRRRRSGRDSGRRRGGSGAVGRRFGHRSEGERRRVDCSRTPGRFRPGWPGASRSTRMLARPPSHLSSGGRPPLRSDAHPCTHRLSSPSPR